MKRYFLFILVAGLFAKATTAQYTQNFDATNALTNGCTVVSNTDRTTVAGEIIAGTGSLYSNPPVNGSGTRDYSTPYLNIADPFDPSAATTSFTVSFDYKLNEALNGQASRYIEIGLQDKNGYTPLTSLVMDKDNDPTSTTQFSQTFTVPAGVKRLVLKMGGSNGNGTVRIIIDNLTVSANPYYSVSGTCNAAPSIQNDAYFTTSYSTFTGSSVLQNDSDPNGESFSAPVVITPSPDGTVVMNPDGTFTFTPYLGFTGSITSFSYQVYDNGYDPASGTATVTIFFQSLSPLPVKLISFEGAVVNHRSQLTWSVDENETGEYFEIEKSSDGRNFRVLSALPASGKSGQESYVYTEGTTLQGSAYYRVKIVSRDNSRAYTKIVYLRADGKTAANGITLLQNPVRSSVAFTYTTAANGTALVNVYNAMGAKVQSFSATLQKGVNTIVQPLDNKLARGSYILEVVTANERSTAKLIK